MHVCSLSRVQLFATTWTVTHKASLSMEFSRQEHWSGLSFSTPRDLPDLGIKSKSLASPTLSGQILYHCASWQASYIKSNFHGSKLEV